ncbi:MAG: thioesterase [Chloroflexi bacterium]|nr:thioesterase [Chloroflexota bacterium]
MTLTNNSGSSWLRIARPTRSSEITLFCFPYSGASAAIYSSWVNNIPNVNVCPVELPGHGLRLSEPLYGNLMKVVELAAEALDPYLDRPFAFFGHSMGSLLSFELARRIRRLRQVEPVHLFVSGHNAPQFEEKMEPISTLPEPEFIEKIRNLNGTDESVFESKELREVFLPILRADFRMCETYRYQPDEPFKCPITALGGLKDIHVPRPDLEAWQIHTTASFKVRMFPGDHFYLTTSRPALLEIIARELNSARIAGMIR